MSSFSPMCSLHIYTLYNSHYLMLIISVIVFKLTLTRCFVLYWKNIILFQDLPCFQEAFFGTQDHTKILCHFFLLEWQLPFTLFVSKEKGISLMTQGSPESHILDYVKLALQISSFTSQSCWRILSDQGQAFLIHRDTLSPVWSACNCICVIIANL